MSLKPVTRSMANLHPIPSLVRVTTEEHKVQTLLSTYLKRTKNTILHLLPTASYYAFNMFLLTHTKALIYVFKTQSKESRKEARDIFWEAHSMLVRTDMEKSMTKLNCMWASLNRPKRCTGFIK